MSNVVHLKPPSSPPMIDPPKPKRRKRSESQAQAEAKAWRKRELAEIKVMRRLEDAIYDAVSAFKEGATPERLWACELDRAKARWNAGHFYSAVDFLIAKLTALRQSAPVEVVDLWKQQEDEWKRIGDKGEQG
jgi:hypothetical protein